MAEQQARVLVVDDEPAVQTALSRAVSISTGVLSPLSRRRWQTSRPSMWGIEMSRITTS
jgi:CheY-like chemotaxis protein